MAAAHPRGAQRSFFTEEQAKELLAFQQVTRLAVESLVDEGNETEWRLRGRSKPGFLRLVLMSDTHTKHTFFPPREVPGGDVFVHAGDFTYKGDPCEVRQFAAWLKQLHHTHKVVIAGNHDVCLDLDKMTQDADNARRDMLDFSQGFVEPSGMRQQAREAKALLQKACTYLEDSAATVAGLRFYGSPWTTSTRFYGFHKDRGEDMQHVWQTMPGEIDVLVTHSPPLGRGDRTAKGVYTGCRDLLEAVQSKAKPILHVFGHIHEGRGASSDGTTTFVNASSLNHKYTPVKSAAIVVDLNVADRQARRNMQNKTPVDAAATGGAPMVGGLVSPSVQRSTSQPDLRHVPAPCECPPPSEDTAPPEAGGACAVPDSPTRGQHAVAQPLVDSETNMAVRTAD